MPPAWSAPSGTVADTRSAEVAGQRIENLDHAARHDAVAGLIDEVADELARIGTVDHITRAGFGALHCIVGDHRCGVVAHDNGINVARLSADADSLGEFGRGVSGDAVNPRCAEVHRRGAPGQPRAPLRGRHARWLRLRRTPARPGDP